MLTIDEAERLHLDEIARARWAHDGAARTLMNLLPPDRDELATKSDVNALGLALRQEMADLRGDFRSGQEALRSDLVARMHTTFIATVGMWITLVALLAAARFG